MVLDKQIPVGTAEDLTNKKFGKLTALYRVENTGKTRGAKWKCQCDCGGTTEVLASNLKNGHTLSCGCIQKEKAAKTHLIDEVGNRYGRLIVIDRAKDYISTSGQHRVMWKCKCDCGNIVDVSASALRSGATTSCGCYRLERISSRVDDKYKNATFHHITILDKTNDKNQSGETLWRCKCNLCQKEFILSTGKLKTQISCGCLQDSYGVSVIKTLLQNNNIPFETEKTFENCIFKNSGKKARFDFYINNRYLLEFDGQQHFSYSSGWNTKKQLLATQKRDEFKNQWCQKHNILLIRIPYWAIDDLKIEDLLPNSKFQYQGGK